MGSSTAGRASEAWRGAWAPEGCESRLGWVGVELTGFEMVPWQLVVD